MGRLLAVDLGTRRVGLALSDELEIIASPLCTLPYKTVNRLIDELTGIIRDKNVDTVVVGLPLREDGSEGEGCVRSREFAGRLEGLGVKTVLWDERYTSLRAEKLLREAGFNRKKAKNKVDRIAASYILEDYMARTQR